MFTKIACLIRRYHVVEMIDFIVFVTRWILRWGAVNSLFNIFVVEKILTDGRAKIIFIFYSSCRPYNKMLVLCTLFIILIG